MKRYTNQTYNKVIQFFCKILKNQETSSNKVKHHLETRVVFFIQKE